MSETRNSVPKITVRGLRKFFGPKRVLGGLDLDIGRPTKAGQPGELADLDLIERVVAADQQHMDERGRPILIDRQHDAFDRPR